MPSVLSKDGAAIALSVACVVHCAVLPVVAISSSIFASFAQAEWLHWIMALLAVFASASVVISSPSSRVSIFMFPSGLGGLLITGALFAEHFGFKETLPTVVGGLLMASAHIYRIYKQSNCELDSRRLP